MHLYIKSQQVTGIDQSRCKLFRCNIYYSCCLFFLKKHRRKKGKGFRYLFLESKGLILFLVFQRQSYLIQLAIIPVLLIISSSL